MTETALRSGVRWVSGLLLVTACGRIDFDLRAGSPGSGDGGGNPGPGDGAPGVGDGPPAIGDGQLAIDALAVPGCGSTPILVDDFSSGSIDARWTPVTSAGYAVTESGGQLHVAFPATAAATTRAGLRQTATVDFTNTCAIAEVAMVPSAASTAYAYLRLGSPAKYLEIYVQSGQLWGAFNTGGTGGTIGPVTYDPVAQRFWRFRNSGGNYAIEAGPSLTQFDVTLGSEGGAVVDPTPSTLEIGGGTMTTQAPSAGMVTFESVTFLGP